MIMKDRSLFRYALLACTAGSCFISSAAFAQAAPPETPAAEEQNGTDIVVTAQRREQSLQNVGISITALSGESLANAGITNAQGLAAQVPGLQFDSGSGGGVNAFVTIRGVSQVDPSEHQEAPNAVYLDEVYVPTPSMVGFPLYDIARAEALRGPQGTLFGRNSTGGLLQFVTTDPSDDWKGFIDASYANYDNVRVEGAVGGPITSGLSFRLAGFVNKGDGIFKNLDPNGKDTFQTNVWGLRGKLAAEFGGGWTAKLTGSLNRSPRHREGAYKSYPVFVDANGIPQYLPENVDFYGTGPGNDPFGYRDRSSDVHSGNFDSNVGSLEKKFNYVTLKVEGPVGGATLTSISNYSYGLIHYAEDADSTPNDINNFGNDGVTKQYSQELRLSGNSDRLNWTVGVYFLDLKGRYQTFFDLPFLAGTPDAFSRRNEFNQHTRSYAVFAQGEYEFTDQLKLTLGARYTRDRKDFQSQVFDLTVPGEPIVYDFSAATVGSLARMKHSDWTGKLQLDYTPSRDVLIYAGISRGFRGGGFNATADGSISIARTPFKEETVLNYEGGVKLRLFDGKASFRTSAFYYDYSDYQAFNFASTVGSVGNNDAKNYGAEFELNANPARGLDISLGLSLLEGKVLDYNLPTGAIQDVDPVKAPGVSFNGQIAKTWDIGDYQLRAQYNANYVSKSRANLFPSPITVLPSSWIQDVRLSFGKEAAGWELYGFVRNLTDEDRKTFSYDLSFVGLTVQSYAPPRTYGAGFRMTF